ncbi:hypothetical protein AAVH_08089 [Aphelenchoides avenae]|nr:hypothetical protein AAVH_08089 [Aphelenchus avenae]
MDFDGKESKVNCTNAANKYCFKADVKFDGKNLKAKGCSGEAHYGISYAESSTMELDCTKNGDNGNTNNPLFQGSVNCCSDKDYCNSAGRIGVGFGLVTVAIASLVAKAVS